MNQDKTNLLVEDFYKKSDVTSDGSDLTFNQINETINTYEKKALDYSKIEWATYSCIKSGFDTRMPFIRKLLQNNMENFPILVAGCGSGRDTFYLAKSLFNLGVENVQIFAQDSSNAMISIAKEEVESRLKVEKIKIEVKFDQYDLRDIDFVNKNIFGSIFCESVLSHFSKSDLRKTLDLLRRSLNINGIAFLGFRLKKDGESNVYSTYGDFGLRHYFRMNINELRKLLYEKKFEIIWGPEISSHTDNKRPPFVNVIVRKVPL